MMPRDVLSTAIRHANGLLAKMDFSVNGAIQRAPYQKEHAARADFKGEQHHT